MCMQCENAIMLMKFQFYAITNQAHWFHSEWGWF